MYLQTSHDRLPPIRFRSGSWPGNRNQRPPFRIQYSRGRIVLYSAAVAPPCTSDSTRLARYAARWGPRMPVLPRRRMPPRQVAAEGWREDDGSRGAVTGLAAPVAASVRNTNQAREIWGEIYLDY